MLEGNESGVIESSQLGEKRSSLNVGCEVQDLTLIILEDRIEVENQRVERSDSDQNQRRSSKRGAKSSRWHLRNKRVSSKDRDSKSPSSPSNSNNNNSRNEFSSPPSTSISDNEANLPSFAGKSVSLSPSRTKHHGNSDPEVECLHRNNSVPISLDDNVKYSRKSKIKDFIMGGRWRKRRKSKKSKSDKDEKYHGLDDSSDSSSEDDSNHEVESGIGLPPLVGKSYQKLDEREDWNRWSNGSASEFFVRMSGYTHSRQKGISMASFYELVEVDAYQSPCRIDNMQSRVRGLDKLLESVPATGHPDIPRLFVINVQLPNLSPSLSSQGDGPTVHITVYMIASNELRNHAKALYEMENRSKGGDDGSDRLQDIPGAVKLLAKWCAQSESDDSMRGRFKLIGDVRNLESVGLPSFCQKFNRKPMLIHAGESRFIRNAVAGIAELDISGHSFKYIGRKGLYGTMHKWQDCLLHVCMLIEGRCDDELPEQVLGVAVFHGLDLHRTKRLSLLSDGKTLAVGSEEEILYTRAKLLSDNGSNTALTDLKSITEVLLAARRASDRAAKIPKKSYHFSRITVLSIIILSVLLGAFTMWISMKPCVCTNT